MNRVIVTGNPGTGKSTILNTLVGSVHFHSGVSLGTGMTTVLKNYIVDGWIYTDTPGLEDVTTRKKAAEEISSTLTRGSNIKLIFVIMLEADRIRPVDITTITQILDAITDVGIDVNRKFSLLVNKVTSRVLEKIRKTGELETLTGQVCPKYSHGFVDYLMYDHAAHDYKNVMLHAAGDVKAVVERAPFMIIEKGKPIKTDDTQFEEQVKAMEAKITELRKEAAMSARIIARLEEESRAAKAEPLSQQEMHSQIMSQLSALVESTKAANENSVEQLRQEQMRRNEAAESTSIITRLEEEIRTIKAE